MVAIEERSVSASDKKALEGICKRVYIHHLAKWQAWFNALKTLTNSLPAEVAYFYNKRWDKQISRIITEERPDMIYYQLIRTALYADDVNLPKAIDYMDAFSLRLERDLVNRRFKWFWSRECRKLRSFEARVYHWFQYHFVISEVDSKYLEHLVPGHFELLVNGVDSEYFKPRTDRVPSVDIVFVGNMSYRPNVLAAVYLVKKIAKTLKKRFPKLKVMIAGATPDPAVKKLANNWVSVTGYLPDVRNAYQQGKVFVAPIFTGSGMQNKILEAMSMELPCVTTPQVNASFNDPDGLLFTASLPHEFVDVISKLLADPDLRKKHGYASRKFVMEKYIWDRCCKPLDKLG